VTLVAETITATLTSPGVVRTLAFLVLAAFLWALARLIGIIRRLAPSVRRGVMFWNALVGENPDDVPPGATPRPGMLDRMASMESALAETHGNAAAAARDSADAKDAALGAQAAAQQAARSAKDAATLAREVSELASQAAESASTAKATAQEIADQFKTNSGTSLRDCVDDVSRRLDEHIATTDARADRRAS
jgi:hypothetical protein